MQLEKALHEVEEKRKSLKKKKAILIPCLILPPFIFALPATYLPNPGPFLALIFGSLFSYLMYHEIVKVPFKFLKEQLKSSLVAAFMKSYHPDIEFNYWIGNRNGHRIIKKSKLIEFDKSIEEDVLQGKMKNANFYISEMKLTAINDDYHFTVFKGMIFELKIPSKKFPESEIQTNQSFWSILAGEHRKHPDYNFYFSTYNEIEFERELGILLPFVEHLGKNNNSIRIRAAGDRLIIMLENTMRFIDDPKLTLNESFINRQYNANLAKQLNTLLFIVESFVNDLGKSEVLEKLELKLYEILKANDLEDYA